jgi:DNA helicase-2/ATP-dependent DNA helicase PcrA
VKVSKLIEEILNSTGYLNELKNSKDIDDISRVENLKELVSAAVEFESSSEDTTLSAFLEKVTLVSDIDNFDQETDSVVMMTVHSAKGLEFPVVFMAGMENGIFPGTQSFNDLNEMEESRRLCYVGITRAREKLYMTSAENRRVFGKTMAFAQSDFVNEISRDLREGSAGLKTAYPISAVKPQIAKSDLPREGLSVNAVNVGMKVRHIKFGVGTIVSISKSGQDVKLTIAFDKMGVKILMLGVAPLEAV